MASSHGRQPLSHTILSPNSTSLPSPSSTPRISIYRKERASEYLHRVQLRALYRGIPFALLTFRSVGHACDGTDLALVAKQDDWERNSVMRRLLQVALASLVAAGGCSQSSMNETKEEVHAHSTQPSPVADSTAGATWPKSLRGPAPLDPATIIPRRVGPSLPKGNVTKEDAEQWRIKQDEEKAEIAKRIADDAAALKARRCLLEERERQWQNEAEAAAVKLDAASRSRLDQVTRNVADAIVAHKKALVELQATSTEATKEAAATTKLRLEEATKKARADLEEQERLLKEVPKNIFNGLLEATALIAALR